MQLLSSPREACVTTIRAEWIIVHLSNMLISFSIKSVHVARQEENISQLKWLTGAILSLCVNKVHFPRWLFSLEFWITSSIALRFNLVRA